LLDLLNGDQDRLLVALRLGERLLSAEQLLLSRLIAIADRSQLRANPQLVPVYLVIALLEESQLPVAVPCIHRRTPVATLRVGCCIVPQVTRQFEASTGSARDAGDA
jgi:hypothetical protein